MGLIDAEKIEINEERKFSGKGIKAFLNAISTAYVSIHAPTRGATAKIDKRTSIFAV